MKRAFYDIATGELVAHGFTQANRPGDGVVEVVDSFDLRPGDWRWDGVTWVPYVRPKPDTPLVTALRNAISSTSTPAAVRAVFQEWLANLG